MALTRRSLLSSAAAAAIVPVAHVAAQSGARSSGPFKFGLNTSTIRGQTQNLMQQIDVTIRAGYESIEPWIGHMQEHVKAGGSLKDAGKKLADAGVAVPSAIGFAKWLADDDKVRAQGLEDMKRDMELVLQLGGTRIAAPASGATVGNKIPLDTAAERYRAVCEVGRRVGVVPELELWGPSKNLSTVADCLHIATAAAHPDACILLDVYHLAKGGNAPETLRMLGPHALHVMHLNDYPADPPRETITDADRIFPGDGVAPYKQIFTTLRDSGVKAHLCLELFNREYWKRDMLQVAQEGLAKSREAVAKALA
jgi:sugar phosphate isomerase/epimerase